jgi:predicted enzyme related to lactoylglutathione lyase
MAQLNPQHNQFVWVDIPVSDLDRAIAFYSAVLAAPVTRAGGPGFQFGLLAHADSGVGGCLVPQTPEHAPSLHGPLVYLNAAGRLHEAVRQAQKNGGSVLQGVHQIGEHGWRAVVTDTEGNRIALHAPWI